MIYDIYNENDFMTGPYLVVKIPENEVDHHALYTIQSDCPDFIVPFKYKSINGQVEIVYKPGTQGKLQYFSGELSPKEYADLWFSLICPLLECGDWFMNPCSFVMNTNYLYYDKTKKSVKYIYIPSVNRNPENSTFTEMAVDISKMMTVSDTSLENKVLRAIIKDFDPVGFLKMLKDNVTEEVKPEVEPYVEKLAHAAASEAIEVNDPQGPAQKLKDDFDFNIQQNKKAEQNTENNISGGYKLFGNKKKKELKSNAPEPLSISAPYIDRSEQPDLTQNMSVISGGPGLRYIGRAHLPPLIEVLIDRGQIYTVGRFDAAVGKKQSNFEFDKKTKAVSRRHAAIERDTEGYKIIDLSSSAGTYVNDKKLQPNIPLRLETGNRVSFGNSGADYVWEVN